MPEPDGYDPKEPHFKSVNALNRDLYASQLEPDSVQFLYVDLRGKLFAFGYNCAEMDEITFEKTLKHLTNHLRQLRGPQYAPTPHTGISPRTARAVSDLWGTQDGQDIPRTDRTGPDLRSLRGTKERDENSVE